MGRLAQTLDLTVRAFGPGTLDRNSRKTQWTGSGYLDKHDNTTSEQLSKLARVPQ